MDKATEAYEEMMQIELEYEVQASNYVVEDAHAHAEADGHDDADRLDKTIEAYEEAFQYERQHHCTN